jgi:hypothetical protein
LIERVDPRSAATYSAALEDNELQAIAKAS